MSETIELSGLVARTRSELHQIAKVFQAQERLLLALAERLPADTGEDDLEEMAEPVELQAVMLCVVKDHVRPAIKDLLTMAGPPSEDAESQSPHRVHAGDSMSTGSLTAMRPGSTVEP